MEKTTVAETTALPEGTMLAPELKKPVEETEKKKKKMRVLMAIDESDMSLYALKWALDNLFRNPCADAGATLPEELNQQDSDIITVVHVVQPFQHYVFPAGPEIYATNNLVASVRKAQSESAIALLSRALKMCTDKHVKAETLILEGDVKERICEAAEQMQVDLLVLGSRGLGMIKRAFLGSVSDYCVHHAKCPTLVVPSQGV